MTFQPGNDLGGRKAGSRNKSSYELRERLKARGDRDPAEFLSEIISNPQEPKELQIAACNVLMPYYHSKLGAIPVPAPDEYFEEAVNLPRPTSIRQACENIALLTEYKSQGKIAIAKADSLINDQRVVLNGLVDEQKLLTAQGGGPDTTIRIEGGLPQLPGTNIIMPEYSEMNGHDAVVTDPQTPEPEPPPGNEQ